MKYEDLVTLMTTQFLKKMTSHWGKKHCRAFLVFTGAAGKSPDFPGVLGKHW